MSVVPKRITLGCECETPTPRGPHSALCEACGLVFLTDEEYTAHLAASRARVQALLQRNAPEPEPQAQPQRQPRPGRWRRRKPALA